MHGLWHSCSARTLCSGLLLLVVAGCGPRGLERAQDADVNVYYGATARISGFDPVKSGDVASSLAIGKVYEGLLEYAYLDRPHHVIPCLAEALPEVSEDGLTYTFRIRRGIFFSDDPCFEASGGKGRELVAADFVYSMKRVADQQQESKGFWVYNGRIAGLDEFHAASAGTEPTDYDVDVAGLRAPDRYTFQITLKEPYPQLLWILSMHYAFAVPREAIEYYDGKDGRDPFVNHPVGTGPYRLASWTRNYRLEFERNPMWAEKGRVERYPTTGEPGDEALGLLEDAGQPVPFIDRIVQYVVSDGNTDWLMFLTGQFAMSGISQDNWDVVVNEERELHQDMRDQGIELIRTPRLVIDYIGFNMDDPLLGPNAKLRQALTCAFNTEEWLDYNNYRVTRPNGPIPPTVAGYSDAPSPYPFDLDRARTLLTEAGYTNGIDPRTGRRLELTIELRAAGGPEVRQRADLLSAFMEKVGVVIKHSYNNWPMYLDKMNRRQAQMFWLGWVADYPDAENFLQLFYGPNSSPGPNHANYVNPEFDRLYEEVRVMPDTPERTAVYQDMANIVIDDCPWIYTSIPMTYILHHQWFKNYKFHDFPYGMFKYYKINTQGREDWLKMYGETR